MCNNSQHTLDGSSSSSIPPPVPEQHTCPPADCRNAMNEKKEGLQLNILNTQQPNLPPSIHANTEHDLCLPSSLPPFHWRASFIPVPLSADCEPCCTTITMPLNRFIKFGQSLFWFNISLGSAPVPFPPNTKEILSLAQLHCIS